jgi:hypothetical protein
MRNARSAITTSASSRYVFRRDPVSELRRKGELSLPVRKKHWGDSIGYSVTVLDIRVGDQHVLSRECTECFLAPQTRLESEDV